jgi:hypothetical protein
MTGEAKRRLVGCCADARDEAHACFAIAVIADAKSCALKQCTEMPRARFLTPGRIDGVHPDQLFGELNGIDSLGHDNASIGNGIAAC